MELEEKYCGPSHNHRSESGKGFQILATETL